MKCCKLIPLKCCKLFKKCVGQAKHVCDIDLTQDLLVYNLWYKGEIVPYFHGTNFCLNTNCSNCIKLLRWLTQTLVSKSLAFTLPHTICYLLDFPGDTVDKNSLTSAGPLVRSLLREDSTWHRAAKPVLHNYWSLCHLKPVLPNERNHGNEKPTHQHLLAGLHLLAPACCN